MGPLGSNGFKFIQDVGGKVAAQSGESRSTVFLMQSIGIVVQKGNAACNVFDIGVLKQIKKKKMTRPNFLKSTKVISSKDDGSIHLLHEIKFFFTFYMDYIKEEETIAKAKFYEKVKLECFQEYKKYLYACNTNKLNWTLLGVHFVLFETLCSFNCLLSKRREHLSKSKNLILAISHCLRPNNQKYISLIVVKDIHEFLQTERGLLKQFILREIKDNTENAKHITFLRDCAERFGDTVLVQSIEEAYDQLVSSTCSQKMATGFESDTATDGNVYETVRDPPGQRCIYIPPGNTSEESYRLSTFLKFPEESPVNPRRLAAAGFYFIGYKDRVKCFSCGSTVENWAQNDDVMAQRWHKFDCKMMLGEDCGNVPMGGLLFGRRSNRSNEQSPSSSGYSSQPSAPPQAPVSNANMQSAGQVLMQGVGNYVLPQPVQYQPPNQYSNNIELATIVSPHHEAMIRSMDLKREYDRRKSFNNWRQVPFTVDPVDLAKSGFFYLGNADRVQCFSCGGVLRAWKPHDNVDSEHRKHFPHCRMVNRVDARNVPLDGSQPPPVPEPPVERLHEPPDPSVEEQESLDRMFPCLYGVNAHMREESVRLETFDSRWPSNRVHATPAQIAKAGFYFLGDGDRVKCWYCNGGLQNWEPTDEPWKEHAKWFPTCEFLLRRKGPDFVHQIVAENPNVRRPILRNPFDVPPSAGRIHQERRAPSPPPPIIDHKAIRRKVQRELPKAMESQLVKDLENMGFETSKIRHCVKRKLKRSGKMQASVVELVEDLTGEISSSSDEEESTPSQPLPSQFGNEASSSALPRSNTSSPMSVSSYQTAPPESMETRIRELQDERQCKVCLDRQADIVFVPCGHLVCCMKCAENLRRCPICRAKIDKGIKTYVS